MIDTEMVTTGPIRPLARDRWIDHCPTKDEHNAGKACVMNAASVDAEKIASPVVHAVNLVARELFPERCRVAHYQGRSDDFLDLRIAGGPAALVNDHPATTFADVCKILDEANRRLA